LKLKHDDALSRYDFSFNLRQYIKGGENFWAIATIDADYRAGG